MSWNTLEAYSINLMSSVSSQMGGKVSLKVSSFVSAIKILNINLESTMNSLKLSKE